MNKKLICIFMASLMLVTLSACSGKDEPAQTASSATNVTVADVSKRDISNVVTYTGELKAAQDASVSSKVSAKVTAVNAEIGDYVTAGKVLASLDTTDYRNAYNQALASYNSAVAAYENVANGSSEQSKVSVNQSLSAAQTAYDNALSEYNRQKQLYDIGAISEVVLNNYKTQLDTAKLNLETAQENYNLTVDVVAPGNIKSAQASVASAKAALDTAASNLNNASVTAPISGYIASSSVKVGQMATPGVEMFTISNSKSVDAEVNVTESVISYITEGSEALVSIKSASIENIKGTVSVVNPVKSAQTGMYTVRVSIPNDDEKLKVGMMADISLTTDTALSSVSVLSESLLEDSDGVSYVYVVNGDKAVRKDVEIGISDTKYTQILSGLKGGEQVVVTGKEYISDKNNEIKITSEE